MGKQTSTKGDTAAKSTKDDKPSKLLKAIREFSSYFNEEMLLADGFEEAFIGVIERCSQPPLACYDVEKCIKVLVKRDKMTYDEAEEFLSFNTLGAWCGEMTPVFLSRFHKENM